MIPPLKSLQFEKIRDFGTDAETARLLINGVPANYVLNRSADGLEQGDLVVRCAARCAPGDDFRQFDNSAAVVLAVGERVDDVARFFFDLSCLAIDYYSFCAGKTVRINFAQLGHRRPNSVHVHPAATPPPANTHPTPLPPCF